MPPINGRTSTRCQNTKRLAITLLMMSTLIKNKYDCHIQQIPYCWMTNHNNKNFHITETVNLGVLPT